MKAWVPWLVAFVVWNLTFDYQLRRAGDAFVAEQLSSWARHEPPALLRDAFTPRVRRVSPPCTVRVIGSTLGWLPS
jgi:hypothetical protein